LSDLAKVGMLVHSWGKVALYQLSYFRIYFFSDNIALSPGSINQTVFLICDAKINRTFLKDKFSTYFFSNIFMT